MTSKSKEDLLVAKSRKAWWILLIITSILVLAIGIGLIYYMARRWVFSDYWGHIELYALFNQYDEIIYPPLYYWVYDLFDKLFWYKYDFVLSTILILSCSILSKYLLTYRYLIHPKVNYSSLTYFIPLGLLVFYPIYLFNFEGKYQYLGKFTSSIWHNCTSTFVWPICILLFLFTIRWIKSEGNQHYILLWILGLLIFLAKPSFLFAYIPSLPILLLVQRVQKEKLFYALGLVLGLLILVGGAKLMVYDFGNMDTVIISGAEKNAVIIDFFGVWNHYLEYPLLDVLSSFAFLIFAILGYYKHLVAHLEFRFALILAFVGLSVFFVLAESGYRYGDMNFYWQVPLTLYILYMVVLKIMIESKILCPRNSYEKIKLSFLMLLFLAHVASGIYYIHNYFLTGYYL
ncbi:hypothetical protein [uncultured Algoriphagus sp.]|uniref:hypothetical protein n=1 Tax=uncultured Algoriphagus sp. TaxID=417365 RepID=UPI0030EB5850|tara:strand:+ start:75643 stop:76848 length:1206 start_codon:yes stop_codon:yes gene_type:complete